MKQTPRVLALLLCLAMLCTMLPGAAMAESEPVGTAEPLTAEGGSYIYAENRWDPDGEVYVGTAEREYREYSTDFFLFKAGAAPVTDGLTSSNEGVATVRHVGDGVWSVGMVVPGTTTLSVVVEGVTYAMVMTFVAEFDPGENPGDDSGNSDVYDVENDTEPLYIHDAWFDAWFEKLAPGADDWHGYFTFHAEEGGESLDPDGRVEFECTEGTTTVTATYVGDDPQVEDLVWVDNLYHIEVRGVGRGILKVIVGDVTYTAEVVVEGDPGSGEPDPGPGGEQTAQLIGKIGQFVGEEGEWMPGTEATTFKTMGFNGTETITIEFFANGTKITNGIGLTSSNTDVASVSWHPVGAWDVRIQGTGVAELSATVDGVTYTYVIIVTDPSSTFSMTAVEYGAGPEGPMPMGRTYEGTYSGNVGNRIMLQFRMGDTPVVNPVNSNPEVVNIYETGTESVFNIELLSSGTATIAATDGNNTYTFTITVDGGSVTPVLTGTIGQFVEQDGSTMWVPGTEPTTYLTMEFTTTETLTIEFLAGETEITEEIGLTSSNTNVATVSWHPVGAWNIIIRGAGVAELSATLNGVTYTYIITVTDPGPGSEEPIEPTGNLFLYDVTFGQWFSGTLRAADHWIGTFSFHGLPFDPALMADNCQFVRTGGSIAVRITQTAGQNGPVYELYVTGTGAGVLYAMVGEEVYSITVTTEQGDVIEPLPTITVDHVEYSIGMGDANEGDSITFLGQGVNTTCHPGWTFVIAAMSGRGTDDMAEAPAKVYDYITNVEVEIIECTNLDADGDQSQPNCSFVCGTMEYRGMQVPCVTMEADEGDYFAAKIRINVTVIDPESGEPEVFVLTSPLRYVDSVWLQLDASDLDTTEKLNAVLDSDQAFVAWMKQKHPDSYNLFINAKIHDMNAYVNVYLPGVVYDGIVVCKVTDNIKIDLYGSQYGDQTVMAGLLIEGCLATINYIAFVANDNLTQTYDGETFTCGIITAGEQESWHFSCVYWIMNCSFTGYDYGVRSTHDGLCMGIQRCMFIECDVGYYLDSYERDGGPWTGEISDSLFLKNTTAVQIETLPSYLSPYNFRIKNCDFIGNSMDFEVNDNGTFYFHSNYFGRIHQKAESESTSDLIQMLAAATTETKLNQVISTHPAQTNKVKGTKIITNPRWKYLYKGWAMYGMVPFAMEEEAPYVNVLISDWTQETQIVDKEANGLIIDGSAFDVVTEDKKVIDVVDEHENALGTWIFD